MLAGVLESPDLKDDSLTETIDDSTVINKTKKNIPPVDSLGNFFLYIEFSSIVLYELRTMNLKLEIAISVFLDELENIFLVLQHSFIVQLSKFEVVTLIIAATCDLIGCFSC